MGREIRWFLRGAWFGFTLYEEVFEVRFRMGIGVFFDGSVMFLYLLEDRIIGVGDWELSEGIVRTWWVWGRGWEFVLLVGEVGCVYGEG